MADGGGMMNLARYEETIPAHVLEEMVLQKLDAAYAVLEEARNIAQARMVADMAATLAEWLRRTAGSSLKLTNEANLLRVSAEHRMGAFLVPKETVQGRGRPGKTGNGACFPLPTHEGIGIKQRDAYRYRELATMPIEQVREMAAEATARDREFTRDWVLRKARERERTAKKAQLTDAAAESALPDGDDRFTLLQGDFREVGRQIEPDSVNLIFTDPPYDQKATSLYADLAEFAARVLVPGGLCLAYSGQAHFLAAANGMAGSLEYLWTCGILHSGPPLRFFKYHLFNAWKPVLLFGKPPVSAWWDWLSDVASGGMEKDAHPWQQSEAEAVHFLSSLCPAGGIVLDPFLGSGTTLAAAAKLGLRGIGIEEDEDDLATARWRLAAEP